MNDEIRTAYADGLNQTADLRFVLRRLFMHEQPTKVLQQRYVRSYWDRERERHIVEEERWIDVPLSSESNGRGAGQ